MPTIPSRYYKMIRLSEDEEIIEIIKQSLVSIWYKFLVGIIFILLPFFLMFYLISQGPVGSSVFVAMIALAIFYCYREWYLWSRNAVIVTNLRVIDIDQNGLFHRGVSEVTHQKIQDISYQSQGVMRTIFGIGHILIKTSVPDLKLGIYNVSSIQDVCARLSKTVEEGGGDSIVINNNSGRPASRTNIDSEEDDENYDEYELKDLIEHYIESYSRAELKKLLYKEIEKTDRDS